MKTEENTKPGRRARRASTLEAREDQLIVLATNLAEEKLRNGTASNSMIIHYLKLGSTKEKLEKDILAEQRELVKAKTGAIKSAQKSEELFSEALKAMRKYSGSANTEDDEDDEEL